MYGETLYARFEKRAGRDGLEIEEIQ